MTDTKALLDLAARCEAATGADRELDAEIHWRRKDGVGVGYRQDAPAYSASLDNALTLVPDGWEWQLEAEETELFFPPSPWTFRCQMGHLIEVAAATPALALCAASLRAIAQEQSK